MGKLEDSRMDCAELRRDLLGLEKWALMWQKWFNVIKCKVISIGAKTPHSIQTLMVSDQEADFGVMAGNSLEILIQWRTAIKKANVGLRVVRKGTEDKSASLMF